jgi:hypothetical protein
VALLGALTLVDHKVQQRNPLSIANGCVEGVVFIGYPDSRGGKSPTKTFLIANLQLELHVAIFIFILTQMKYLWQIDIAPWLQNSRSLIMADNYSGLIEKCNFRSHGKICLEFGNWIITSVTIEQRQPIKGNVTSKTRLSFV